MDILYSLLIAMGIITGLAWSIFSVPPRQSLRLADQGLLVLFAALVGARAGYVGLNWEYFQAVPGEIAQVWLGGLSGYGAACGFLCGLVLAAWLHAESLLVLADRLVPLGLSLAAAGWLAAWWGGSAYGTQVDAWFALPARAETGLWARRFPTQLLGSLLTLILWTVLDRLIRPKAVAGIRAAFTLLGIGLTFTGLSLTRVDPLPQWRSFRIDTWAGLGLVTLAVGVLLWLGLAFLVHALIQRKKMVHPAGPGQSRQPES